MAQMDLTGLVEVRYGSSGWGPFTFEFTDVIPSGTAIESVVVTAYEGRVDPEDDVTAETEISDLVNTAAVLSDTYVTVTFDYPGADYEGNHTLRFLLTLDSGAIHPFFFYKVQVH